MQVCRLHLRLCRKEVPGMIASANTQTPRETGSASDGRRPGMPAVAARGFALFLSGFTALNLLGEFRRTGFNLNLTWIDLRPLPPALSHMLLAICAAFLLAYAVKPEAGPRRRRVTLLLCASLCAAAAWNAIHYYLLLAEGAFETALPVPLSLLTVAGLAVVAHAVRANAPAALRRRDLLAAGAVLAVCLVLFPVAQMLFFGKTDYTRPADAIVVFGARVYRDGRLSDALADRVRTGCALQRAGLADKIIFSGGPGDGEIHETQSMSRFALELVVPEEDIILDPDGVNTRATVKNTCRLFRRTRVRRILAVSHFFHLPRIKMSYHREGYEVYTVPARETYVLTQMPYLIVRETGALWFYYLRCLAA